MIFLLENIIRGGISSVMGDTYVRSDNNKKIICIDANKLYGWAMSQSLPYDENKFETNFCLEEILKIPDDWNIGYFIRVDLQNPDKIKQKRKNFHLLSKTKNFVPIILVIK